MIALLISCSSPHKERISKLIYFSGRNISYDSLKLPQLSLMNYFEYSYNNDTAKLAKGKPYFYFIDRHLKFEKAPPFSLDEFFSSVISDSLIEKFNTVLIDNSFDTTYDLRNEGNSTFQFLIFETSLGKKKVIHLDKNSLPDNIIQLKYKIWNLFSHDLSPVKRFGVDTCVFELQSEIFKRLPPMPPPPPVSLEQFVKYKPPIIIRHNNRWRIEKKDGQSGFIDSLGNEIFIDKFNFLNDYEDGLAFFQKGSLRGYLDEIGKIIISNKEAWNSFSEGLVNIEDSGKFYYLNTKGEIALNLENLVMPEGKMISFISGFHDGLAMIRIQNIDHKMDEESDVSYAYNRYPGDWSYGFINKKGQWAIQPDLVDATAFEDGLSVVEKNGKYHFMNTKGTFISSFDYSVSDYSEGFAIVYTGNDKCFYINTLGRRLNELEFDKADPFSDGMAAIVVNDKSGFINTSGQIVIEPKYYSQSEFKEGLAPVSLQVKEDGYFLGSYFMEGFIDKKGEIVIPFEKHVDYQGFENGLSMGRRFIHDGNKHYTGYYELFYINKKGKKVWSEILKQ